MKLFLATHGKMASGMKSSIEILNGRALNLTVFDAYLDKRIVKDEIEVFLSQTADEEVKILLSDIYGGSVCQVMLNYLSMKNVYIITGVNLAILLSLVTYPGEITKPELQKIIESAKLFTCMIDDEEMNRIEMNQDLLD